jgi:hypothetical protein
MQEILVKKGDGSLEPLDMQKVKMALQKSGAGHSLADEVIDSITPKLYPKIPTKEIYAIAFDHLKRLRPGAAARFSLKSALFKFGPDGYPFETFVGSILHGRNYQTWLRQIVRGKCVSHEIDVIARRPAMDNMPKCDSIVECKFHNSPGIRCHIQSALYSWARFLDIRDSGSSDITSAWLVTNTKFTSDVIQYADCVGLRLLGWSFPASESIQLRIEEKKLYPITVLNSLDKRTFATLHNSGIILVPELLAADSEKLASLHLPQHSLNRILDEAKKVMSTKN